MNVSSAEVGDGVQLSYIDSGAPPSPKYTTLVCVHGHTYTARESAFADHLQTSLLTHATENFSKLLPLAADYNLRIVAVNRRDYAGSTRFSDAELEVIRSSDDAAHADFLRERGLEMAKFLAYLVKGEGIPEADGKSGGLALLGWSLGNIVTLAFLRHLSSYPVELQETLRPYLRHFLIYEGGIDALGFPAPEGSYHPLRDPTIPTRMSGLKFGAWVSSYYKHSAYTSDAANAKQSTEGLSVRTPTGAEVFKPSTLDRLTPRELLSCIDAKAGERSEQPFWVTVKPATVYDLTRGALVVDGPPEDAAVPDIAVSVVYGHASIWSVQWATWKLEEDMARWREEGLRNRHVEFHAVEEGNHFLHWDEPAQFLRTTSDAIHGNRT